MNKSDLTDPVTITSLVSQDFGSLAGKETCSVGFTIASYDQYTCTFTQTVSGSPGDDPTDTVTASGTDDEGIPVSGSDSASIWIVAKPTPKVRRVDGKVSK